MIHTTNIAPKYTIRGDDVPEIPESFLYVRRDSIQPLTLWFSQRHRAPTGCLLFAYHIKERYIKKTESGGSLPDDTFHKMLIHVVIS